MNIVIRTDASIQIGTGHVMRCLTLAKKLQRRGATVTFICRDFEGSSISYLRGQGVSVHSLPAILSKESDIYWTKMNWRIDVEETIIEIKELNEAVDLVIVDHYGLDSRWESDMRNVAKKIMVIDDLADRLHDCDLLLDQNYYLNMEERYNELVPAHCVQMLGPNYVLLRDEFIQMANKPRKRTGEVKNILVFFGGTDPTGETIKALKAIKELDIPKIKINVVVGASNPRRLEVEQLCSEMPNANYYCQVSNMAELMWEADLSIGAGGATTWERCFLGLPALVVVVAENQFELTMVVAKQGALMSLGSGIRLTKKVIKKVLMGLIQNPSQRVIMNKRCVELINCKIVEKYPVTSEILELLK